MFYLLCLLNPMRPARHSRCRLGTSMGVEIGMRAGGDCGKNTNMTSPYPS